MNVPQPTEGAIVEFSRRLRKLHKFIREGKGDSDEADALRDEMDDVYFRLTPEEIERLESLSADLHVLGEDRPLFGDQPADEAARRQMLDAGRMDDWGKLRSLLDADANSSDLFDRTLFRALYWGALEDYESSLEFLKPLAVGLDFARFQIEARESRLAQVGRIDTHDTVVEKLNRLEKLDQLALARIVRVSGEINRLIVDVQSMLSSAVGPGPDMAAWNVVKERFLQAERAA